MKRTCPRFVLLVGLGILSFCEVVLGREWGNQPYVKSGPTRFYYARCIPTCTKGTNGVTEIFEVARDSKERDKLIDRYNWYSGEIVLARNTNTGKIAVMALGGEAASEPDKQIELSFYLGGKLLRLYTTKELIALGAEPRTMFSCGGPRGVTMRVLGSEQIPNTNGYIVSVEVHGGKKLSFDMFTGAVYKK